MGYVNKIISMIEIHETFTSFCFLKRQHCLQLLLVPYFSVNSENIMINADVKSLLVISENRTED